MAIHFSQIPATFINIPKTGTTSLRWWVRDNNIPADVVIDPTNPDRMSHLTRAEMTQRWGKLGLTFAFVRNPFARAVSMFHHLGQDAEDRLYKRRMGIPHVDLIATPIESDVKILGVYRRGFESWVIDNRDLHSDCMLAQTMSRFKDQSQMSFLEYQVPDIVIKIENADTEFKQIQQLVGCDAPLQCINSSVHGPYRDYYNDKTKAIVAEWFKDDLNQFNYDF